MCEERMCAQKESIAMNVTKFASANEGPGTTERDFAYPSH